MDVEKLFKHLVAKIDDNQAKAGADRKAWREEIAAWQEKMGAEMEAIRRETVAIRAETKAWREEMAAMRDKRVNDNHDETLACQEMEARQEEEGPTSADRKPEVAQDEKVPAEDAKVIPVGEPKKKRCRDQKLAVERRRQEPRRDIVKSYITQESVTHAENWSLLELGRHTVQEWHDSRKMPSGKLVPWTMWYEEPGKDGRAESDNMRKEGTDLTRNQDFEERLQLGSEMTTNRSYRKAIGLEIMKRAARTSTGLPKMKNWTLWRGRPPPKQEKGNSPYGRNR
jgi:hypothetical protein